MRTTRTILVAGLSALAIFAPFGAAANASEPEPELTQTTTTDLPTSLPPVPADLMSWASATQSDLTKDDQFLTVRLSDDRTGAEVFWHGETTAALEDALDAVPSAFDVSVEQTEYLPGELRRAATDLLAGGTLNGEEVTATWTIPDGSGIGVSLEEVEGPSARRALPSEFAGFPLEVERGSNEAAIGRQDDDLHIGGSRIYNRENGGGCTMGFAVHDYQLNIDGGMFASHCGNNGDRWARNGVSSLVALGTTRYELDQRDGAIITDTYFQPGVYIGSYTSDAYVLLTGVANPVQNTELCYSGSYSGTVCGNLVSVPNYNYTLTGVGAINGFRTAQLDGLPALGNGDSGGPSVVPVAAPSGGVYLWAGGITSAMPSNNKSANCQGVPGTGPVNSTNPADRQCSHIGISTRAFEIAQQFGFTIQTVRPS